MLNKNETPGSTAYQHRRAEHHSAMQTCWTCSYECKKTLYTHCLALGGEHVAEQHVKAMTDCIQICQITADFLARESELHAGLCMACAEICDSCAQSCKAIGDTVMTRLAEICTECAQSCRETAQM